jgi:hypothetical protein
MHLWNTFLYEINHIGAKAFLNQRLNFYMIMILQDFFIYYFYLADTHFAPQSALLLGRLCFPEHTPQQILLPGTHCPSNQFAP